MALYSPCYLGGDCSDSTCFLPMFSSSFTRVPTFVGIIPYVASHQLSLNAGIPQGKVAELRAELNSGGKKDKNNSAKKIALKKIVANMTMSNNDMVGLFPDVIACMAISSLEIKKMYVMAETLYTGWSLTFTGNQVLPVFSQLFEDEAGGCIEGAPVAGRCKVPPVLVSSAV